MNANTIRLLAVTLLICLSAIRANAAADEKFFKNAAKTVWSMEIPEFDPKADLSDSIFTNCSASRIAYMRNIVAGLDNGVSIMKYLNTGKGATSATSAVDVIRVMVKLHDQKAVEEYSDFDIDAKFTEGFSSYSYASTHTAFGARVHKPDGRMENVDISDTFTLTEGKKNRDKHYRIAIPGLSPGDVVEYFFYTEMYLDEMSLPPFIIPLTHRYPTKSFLLECNVADELTLEYMPMNGAPALSRIPAAAGKKSPGVGFRLENVPAFDIDIPFFSISRQVPFIELHIMNNNSNLVYHPQSARIGGIRIPTANMVINDIACSIAETSLPPEPLNKATSLVKRWRKAHPEASERELIDATWLATIYAMTVDDRRFSNRAIAVYFTDALKKAGVKQPGYIGVTSSRKNVPISKMIHYNSPHYFTQVGDSSYIDAGYGVFAPGDIPGYYAGEEAIRFAAKRDHKFYPKSIQRFKLPIPKASANNANVKIKVSLSENDPSIAQIDCQATFTGTYKQSFSGLVDQIDRLEAIESYLGIDPKERGNRYNPDPVKRSESKTKIISQFGEILLGSKLQNLNSHEVTSRGCTPAEPKLAFHLEGDIEGITSHAGNNLLVNIGSLIGKQLDIKGSQRKREVDILRRSPDNTRIDIMFTLPSGYGVTDESLESLCRNVSNNGGTFFTKAAIDANDPSLVTVSVNIRNPKTHYPLTAWDDILTLNDALVDFTTASIMLTPR